MKFSLAQRPPKIFQGPSIVGSGDRISFDSLMIAKDKFTCQIFDLRFNQVAIKKAGDTRRRPLFLW